MHGLIIHPLVSVLKTNDERSELTTQFLFGETVKIIEVNKNWIFVENQIDNYRGWVDRKVVKPILEPAFISDFFRIIVPVSACKNVENGEIIFLPSGCILHNYEDGRFGYSETVYEINPNHVQNCKTVRFDNIIYVAKQFLNAPYLWGGKSILGIDCSGLVQVVFSLCGILLPRDADQQLENGIVVDFLTESKAGDLAFFDDNDGRIIHVGIMLNDKQIIHASGWVKIEYIDNHGIISAQTGEYSHHLCIVKRLNFSI